MTPPPAQSAAAGQRNPWLVAIAVMLATFMEVLDTSIAAVALPYIAGSLSATNDEATWVLTSYLVANAIILPASSWFSLRFGRKRFLIICITIFTISSFACGSATTLGLILIARAVQGAEVARCSRCHKRFCWKLSLLKSVAWRWPYSRWEWSWRLSWGPRSVAGLPILTPGDGPST